MLFFAYRKHMVPETFFDPNQGYGFRKPHWARSLVCMFGLPISGLVDLVLNYKEKKEYKAPGYRRFEWDFWVTDPTIYTEREPTEEERVAYFSERLACVNSLIKDAGWRAVFLRYCIEMPSHNVKSDKGKTLRETKFIVY